MERQEEGKNSEGVLDKKPTEVQTTTQQKDGKVKKKPVKLVAVGKILLQKR
jgi:hypothetical protein